MPNLVITENFVWVYLGFLQYVLIYSLQNLNDKIERRFGSRRDHIFKFKMLK